ncbi:hypothetical protein AB7W33_19690 [Providencia rettgeri]
MMRARLLAILIDVVVAASLYFGLALNNEGLTNIGYFTGWLFAVMGYYLSSLIKRNSQKPTNTSL